MLRRGFLVLPSILGRNRNPEGRVPTEPEELNAFALAYGRYIEGLRNGVIDLKQWRRVVDRWIRMTT